MTTPTQKQNVSAFAGIGTHKDTWHLLTNQLQLLVLDVYMSDFGQVSVVPNRFMTSESDSGEVALVLDPEMASVMYLRPFQTNELAKAGDAEKTQLLAEYTLVVNNEAAYGICADLTE